MRLRSQFSGGMTFNITSPIALMGGRMKTGKAAALMFPAILAIALLLGACSRSGSGGGLPTFKKLLVHDTSLNDVISAGDAAAAAKDFSGAMRAYQKAASDSDAKVRASAYNRIGELYESGLGVTQNQAESVEWFTKAAELGNAYGAGNLGNSLFFALGTNRDLAEAERWAKQGAEHGVVMSMNQLGWQYLHGMGVTQDMDAARHWYETSAATGDPTGENMVGWIFVHVPPKDYEQGMAWYRKAADQNDEVAQNNIGYLYENGLGVARDYRQAAHWYETAADAGFARAMFHLGNLYDQGLGVEANPQVARRLMQKAAKSGDEEAAQWLSAH